MRVYTDTRSTVVLLLLLVCTRTVTLAQTSPKDWTPWSPVKDNWVEFYVFVEFRGGSKTPDELAKAKPKSLKVDNRFIGRINSNLPAEVRGVKMFRINYAEFGKVVAVGDFLEDFQDVYYEKGGVTNVRSMVVTRPAVQFDIAEASKPATETTIVTKVPEFLTALGVDLITTAKLVGRMYRVQTEWRRKGSTVEIRLKDYRPQT